MSGTKVRFVAAMNSMDWYLVDFLATSGDSLGFKGEYAPHGLEVRKVSDFKDFQYLFLV